VCFDADVKGEERRGLVGSIFDVFAGTKRGRSEEGRRGSGVGRLESRTSLSLRLV